MAKFKKGRRPHNAGKGHEFETVGELFNSLAAEPKTVTVNGEEVQMSWAERSFRLTIDRALSGNRRDLAHLLRLMIKHPSIGGSYRWRQIVVIGETLARC